MVKRRWKLLVISCLSMICVLSMTLAVSAAETKKDGWYYETVETSGREGFRYYIDGSLKVLSWMYNTETGVYYYLDAEGIMTTGWGEGYAEGYYFDPHGIMVTGWHYLMASASEVPDSTVQSTTNLVEASSPMEEAEYSGWYFFKSDGSMAVGWEKINDSWYYFADEDVEGFCKGQMVVGKVNLEGSQYYFDDDTGKMKTGFVKDDGEIYYYSAVGMLKKNSWIKSGSYRYYAGADGKLYTGRGSAYAVKRVGNEYYAFDNEGKMAVDKTLYYVNERWTTGKPTTAGIYSSYVFAQTGVGTAGTYIVE